MKYEFHPHSLEELEAAAEYYSECQPGLEIRFIDAVQTAIKNASTHPFRSRIFYQDIRRVLLHVFPYAVLYSVEEDFIYIIAVMHCRREPDYWKTREKLK